MQTSSRTLLVALGALVSLAFVVPACGSDSSEFGEGTPDSGGGAPIGPGLGGGPDNKTPDGGDPYANDPPPRWCGPAGQPEPPKPGGTADCPDDKNKPGCGCTVLGEKKPCWTGLRANRNLGVCKDGETTCTQINENVKAWGPCEGQVLPTSGVTKGKDACKCFSLGQWKIANLSPCTAQVNGTYYSLSTVTDGNGSNNRPVGEADCPKLPTSGVPPVPGSDWSTDTLKVDCAGHFKLCYELKVGNFDAPTAADCSLAKVCVEADYLKEDVEQTFPNLGPWRSTDSACAQKWETTGGYGEMTVVGESVRCDKVDDGAGNAFVFNRVKYCPSLCREAANAGLPECQGCQQGGSGEF